MLAIVLIMAMIIILFGILNKLNNNYCSSQYYRNHCFFENRIEHREDVPKGLDFINLGSGYGRFAFDYSQYQGAGFNFAQSPQCLEYDFKILQQFSDRLKDGCIVCITLPVFIFGFRRYTQIRYNAKYYSCLEAKYIHNYSPILKIVCTKYPLLIAGKKAIYAFYNKIVPHEFYYKKCMVPKENRERYLKEHIDIWLKQFRLKNLEDASVLHLKKDMKYNVMLLSKMIDYCISQGWRPVLVTTPLYKDLNYMFSKEFLDEVLYNNIKAANVKGVPYLDYRAHDIFQDNIDMFWNGVDWLSAEGRRRFMEMMMRQLLSEGKIYE